MAGEPLGIVVSGLAKDLSGKRIERVAIRMYVTPEGGRMEVSVVGRPGPPLVYKSGADRVEVFDAFVFGAPSGGGDLVVSDPVNLDGSPRNALRDRLARRAFEPEGVAAD
jgi:hypothetical protein